MGGPGPGIQGITPSSSGLDTPPTVTSLPFSVGGQPVLTLTQSSITTANGVQTVLGGGNQTGGAVLTINNGGMSITNGGLQIPNGLLFVNGTQGITTSVLTASSTASNSIYTAGGVKAAAYFHLSDQRLKTDIHPIDHALDKLLAINGVQFNWKDGGRPDMGVVAQNVAEVFPDIVSKDKDGVMSVEYDSLVGPMIEAMRELKAENTEVVHKLSELKAENDVLRDKVAALEQGRTHPARFFESDKNMKIDNAQMRTIRADQSEATDPAASIEH